jgi:hypothetical protein
MGSGVIGSTRHFGCLRRGSSPLSPASRVRSLCEHVFVSRGPRYSPEEARSAIAASRSWAEALRRLGMCHTGGAHATLGKYAAIWEIATDHFDPYASVARPRCRSAAAARRDPCAALGVLEESPEGTAVRRRPQATRLRALWPGRSLERTPNGLDPGSRQRRHRRPPLSQPAHSLSELCGDPGHPLRPKTAADTSRAGLRALREVIPPPRRPPALLLAGVRHALGPIRGSGPTPAKLTGLRCRSCSVRSTPLDTRRPGAGMASRTMRSGSG